MIKLIIKFLGLHGKSHNAKEQQEINNLKVLGI